MNKIHTYGDLTDMRIQYDGDIYWVEFIRSRNMWTVYLTNYRGNAVMAHPQPQRAAAIIAEAQKFLARYVLTR